MNSDTTIARTEEGVQAQLIARERDEAVAHDEKNYQRSISNRRFYWGLDADKGLGQWPQQGVEEMVRLRRQIATFNISAPILDQIAGAMLKSPFSVNWSPVSSMITRLTHMLKGAYLSDYELCDWAMALIDIVLNGLIYRADAEIFNSHEYDSKFGNVGLRCRLPGTVVYSPNWKTRPSKDCKKCWVDSWLTPLEMMDVFKGKAEAIDRAIWYTKHGRTPDALRAWAQQQLILGEQYGENRGPHPYSRYDDEWGSQRRVTTEYTMRTVRRTYDYVLTNEYGPVRIPDLPDAAAKIHWLNATFPDGWRPDAVWEDEEEERVQIARTICPSLLMNTLLGDGPTEVQCNRLQFIPWSVDRLDGESKGLIDTLRDANQQTNYLLSMQMYKLQTEGGGGAQFVDPSAFKNRREFLKYCNNRNNPTENFELKDGALARFPNGPAVPVRQSQWSADINNYLMTLLDTLIPRISKVVPATQGRTEQSGESGYLYRLKKLQADIAQYTMYESYRLWWNEVLEAYYYQATHQYGNGVQREFYNVRDGNSFTINERVTGPDGAEYIKNDFSMLRQMRHKVVITEDQHAPTRQIERMVVAQDAMRALPPDKMLTRMKLGTMLATSMDQWSPEDREELERIGDLEMALAEQNMRTALAEARRREAAAALPAQAEGGGAAGEPPATSMGGNGAAAPGAGGAAAPRPALQERRTIAPPGPAGSGVGGEARIAPELQGAMQT